MGSLHRSLDQRCCLPNTVSSITLRLESVSAKACYAFGADVMKQILNGDTLEDSNAPLNITQCV
jgi:hypothetical protein